MNPTALLQSVAQVGGRFIVRDGRLHVTAPAPLPNDLMVEMRTHIQEIRAELRCREIAAWPAERREAFEERAAIMQFDAKLTRADAEWFAYLDSRGLLP